MLTLGLATTLSSAVFELLANPHTLKKLKAELSAAFPDLEEPTTFSKCENLPYLGAVISECLRTHPGVVTRMARVSPDVPVSYNRNGRHYIIPAGVPMSMTSTHIHFHPDYFDNPNEFQPERWLDNPRLDKYLIAFSRGTRNCLGYVSFRKETLRVWAHSATASILHIKNFILYLRASLGSTISTMERTHKSVLHWSSMIRSGKEMWI
jgi:cytochrome P450